MLSFETLSKYSMECPPRIMLGRSMQVQSKYDTFMREDDNKCAFIEKIRIILNEKSFHFVKNDFPYHTVDGIEHWLCWYDNKTDINNIISLLKKKNNIITCWKNYSFNMSIQEINHIHVFIQK